MDNSSLYKVRSQNFEINQMVEFSVVEFSELTSQSVNQGLNFYLELQKNVKNKNIYKNSNRTHKKEKK